MSGEGWTMLNRGSCVLGQKNVPEFRNFWTKEEFQFKTVWSSHECRLGKPLSLQETSSLIPRGRLLESHKNASWVSLWACQACGLCAHRKSGRFPRVFSGFFSFCAPQLFLGNICVSLHLCVTQIIWALTHI